MSAFICYKQPKKMEERLVVANDFVERTKIKTQFVVDKMSNEANTAYTAWPERLYLMEKGKIIYKGGRGPFGYIISQVDAFLEKHFI